MIINFKVRNQEISCTSHRFITADSVKFLKAEFLLDEDWIGYTITATFTNLDTKVSRKVLLDETHICEIPHEVLAGKGRMNVYIEGIQGDSIATTAAMESPLRIKRSGKQEAGESIPPTPDIYQQLMAQFNGFQESETVKGRIKEAVDSYFLKHPSQGGGSGMQSIGIDGEGHLITTLADGSVMDAGLLPEGRQGVPGVQGDKGEKGDKGEPGADGYAPSIEVATNTDTEYRLNIVNKEETITTPNLRNDSAPVGTIISYMGVTAPNGYLVCDGTRYQVADYPLLAEHFKTHFNSANYFGGDGIAAFAVPDLRGEFLRGAGEAARKTGAGSTVGAHQHPTEVPHIAVNNNTNALLVFYDANQTKPGDYNVPWYIDKEISAVNLMGFTLNKDVTFTPSHKLMRDTTRPTNTSILYCIKYC